MVLWTKLRGEEQVKMPEPQGIWAIDRLKMRGKRKMNLAYSELLVLSNWKHEVSLCRGKENVEMHVWRLRKKWMKTINKHMDTKAGKGGWDESGDWDWHIYNAMYKIDLMRTYSIAQRTPLSALWWPDGR